MAPFQEGLGTLAQKVGWLLLAFPSVLDGGRDAEPTLSGTALKTAGPSQSHAGSAHVSGCDVKQLTD